MDEVTKHIEIEKATRSAVRDILLGTEGQMLMARVAEEAARTTLTDFMLKIGMDTTSPQSILALQLDMQHLHWWRTFVSSGAVRALGAVLFIIASGTFGLFMAGIKGFFEHNIAAPPP